MAETRCVRIPRLRKSQCAHWRAASSSGPESQVTGGQRVGLTMRCRGETEVAGTFVLRRNR